MRSISVLAAGLAALTGAALLSVPSAAAEPSLDTRVLDTYKPCDDVTESVNSKNGKADDSVAKACHLKRAKSAIARARFLDPERVVKAERTENATAAAKYSAYATTVARLALLKLDPNEGRFASRVNMGLYTRLVWDFEIANGDAHAACADHVAWAPKGLDVTKNKMADETERKAVAILKAIILPQ